jgi:hypothetical protein
MKKKSATRGGLYIPPGLHIFKILSCIVNDSKKPGGGRAFIAELETVQSSCLDVGSRPSYFVEMVKTEYPELAEGNISDFMRVALASAAAAAGEEPDEFDDDIADWIVSGENPMEGVLVSDNAFLITTKKGAPFTKNAWAVPDNLAELLKAA